MLVAPKWHWCLQSPFSRYQPWLCPAHVTLWGLWRGAVSAGETAEQRDPADAPVYQIRLSKTKPLPSLSKKRL